MPARFRWAVPVIAVVALGVAPALTTSAAHAASKDDTPVKLTPKGEHEDGSDEASFDKLRDAYYWSRLLAGDDQLTIGQAAQLRQQASTNASGIQSETVKGKPRGGTWQQVGPNPIVQVARTSNTFAGRERPGRGAGDPRGRDAHPRCRTGRGLDLRPVRRRHLDVPDQGRRHPVGRCAGGGPQQRLDRVHGLR